MVKFTLKNTGTFKSLLQKMSKNLPEAVIKFAKDKITLFGMDDRNILAGKLIIPRQYFKYSSYEPIKNIGVRTSDLCTFFRRLKGDVTLSVEGKKLVLSAKHKKFGLGILRLGNRHDYKKRKPIVSWDTGGRIEGIKRIYMWLNKGPLVITSVQDGYELSWIIAPNIVTHKKRK